ncbi:MAG: hypothetical protein ABSG46_20565 [Candidatus Binataceae bacterium]|jgi:hypothetical protein
MPVEPVDVWDDRGCPMPKVSLVEAKAYIEAAAPAVAVQLYITDQEQNDFVLLESGEWEAA